MRNTLWGLALLAVGHGVGAQQPPPSAGSQLLQIPPSPVTPRGAPEFKIEQLTTPAAAAGADGVKILVDSLQVEGATLFPQAELVALTGFKPGSELTLADLQAMVALITAHYRRNGYFAAQAFIPAQDIQNKSVLISVREGRYGKLILRNESQLSARLAGDALNGIKSGDVIATAPLESRLLMLSDIPGVQVKSTLVPGASSGTSDLLVDILPGRRLTGSVDADNAGGRYTGEARVGATVNLNNPLGQGDVLSLRVLTSGQGLRYARASYQMQVGRAQLGVAYSILDYSLRREFESLGAHGTAAIASVYGRYPLIRSRNDNVYVQLAYDAKTFHDRVDSTSSATDRRAGVLMASIYGDHRDSLGAGGLSSYFVTWSSGNIDILTPSALAADAITARSNGHFNKLSFHAMRLQSLGGPFSLYAAVGGQMGSKNLDVSEKMELGGMNMVRAYPEGEAYADRGIVLTMEARMDLPKFSERMPGQLQLIGFADVGTVRINEQPWTTGENHRTLSGAGFGLNWGEPGNYLVRTAYAFKLGNSPATSAPDRSGRFWIQGVKYF